MTKIKCIYSNEKNMAKLIWSETKEFSILKISTIFSKSLYFDFPAN